MPANGLNQTRSLDRMLRQLRSLLRSHRLPRPDRLVLSTVLGTATVAFTTGTGTDRVAALLLWSLRLDAVTLAWSHPAPGDLVLTLTGRTAAGIPVQAGATVHPDEVSGELRTRHGVAVAYLPGGLRLGLHQAESLTYEELSTVVRAARTAVPLAGGGGVSAPTEHPGYHGVRALMQALFGPSGRRPDWQQDAACVGTDPDDFYTKATAETARKVCQGCPVLAACLADQLAWEDRTYALRSYADGVVGGLTAAQRQDSYRATRTRKAVA